MSVTPGSRIKPYVQHASQNGLGVNINANGDYSGGEVYWEIRPAANEKLRLTRLMLHIEDDGNFRAEGYGVDVNPLSNGIVMSVVRGTGATATTLGDFTNSLPILSNAEWGGYCYDIDYVAFGAGNNSLNGRLTFTKFMDAPLYLDGAKGDAFRITLNDKFDFLVHHYFLLEGHYDPQMDTIR